MRFKVVVEFIQSTDPGDFRLVGKKTPERIAKAIMEEFKEDFSILTNSLEFAQDDRTIKIVKVEYLDDKIT